MEAMKKWMGIGKNLTRNWEVLLSNSKFYDAIKLIHIQNKQAKSRNRIKNFKKIAKIMMKRHISLNLNELLEKIAADINNQKNTFNYFNDFKQSVANINYVYFVFFCVL